MTLGDIIRAYREEHEMSMDDFAKASGISKAYISLLEKKINPQTGKAITPSVRSIKLAANAMHCDFDVLFKQLEGNVSIVSEQADAEALSTNEVAFLKKYRALDNRGRDVVDYILEEEYFRCQQMEEAVNYNDSMVPMLFAGYRAAAGRWVYDENMEVETILVKRKEGADFVIGVSGDSMEPDFNDGDMVYVKRTSQLEFGDVGLFQIGDEYYVKELGPDGLHSRNPKWSVIPKSEDIIVVGKVLGKVEKEKPWRPEKRK